MSAFDPQAYGPRFAPLLVTDRCRPLGPGTPDPAARQALAELSLAEAFAHARLVDRQMGELCLSGLWLLYDYLEESHQISQQISTAAGSYWHGIMHRREPDYGNSKYWFRQVGEHPVFEPLQAVAAELAQQQSAAGPAAFLATQKRWDPFRFVDLCQQIATGESRSEPLARQIAQREWELLFDHCYQAAVAH